MMLSSLLEAARAAWSAGEWDEALRIYEQAISRAREQGGAREIADIFRHIGNVHRERGNLELASEAFEVSLAIAEANGLEPARCAALMGVAAVEFHRGNLDAAEEIYLSARQCAQAIADSDLVARVDQNLGVVSNIRGDVERALHWYAVALEHYQRGQDHLAIAGVLTNMGMAHVDLEEWSAAEACYDRAFTLAEQLQIAGLLGPVEINRAELYIRSGSYERARECCDRAFQLFSRLESESGLGESHKLYGILYRETRRASLADASLAAAVSCARRCQDRLLEAESLREWALVHLEQGRSRDALLCLNDAHRLFGELHAGRELLDLNRRLDQLEGTYLRVVQAWGESIESKDRYTAGHCERVANYACLLAEEVGITGRDLTWLRMGGYLHDVGKIAVPAEVLNKPGKLTDEEWKVMKDHTVEGDAIVAELNFPWDIRPVVRSHHERWDGSGYPDGLKGEEIPLTARILCLADVYDALTTTRSYRSALSREETLDIMERDVGRMFDPELFPRFRAIITRDLPAADLRFPNFRTEVAAA